MIEQVAEAKASKDEDAFHRDHPILWWMTLTGPFALTALILLMVWEFAGAKVLWQLVSTVLATFFFFGKFVILGGSEGQLLDSRAFFTAEQLVVVVLYMDFMTACVLTAHLGLLFRLPLVGMKLRMLAEDGEFILRSNPWMKRATYVGLVAFVVFPLAATGSVGGSVFGRLLGVSRLATFLCLAIGNVLGCALMYFGSELITRHIGRDDPRLVIGGIAVIVTLLFILNYRYSQLKARSTATQIAGNTSEVRIGDNSGD